MGSGAEPLWVHRHLMAASAAARAGLRDGDELAGYSVYRGEPDREAVLHVKRDGENTEIRFFPRASGEVDGYRYKTRPGAAGDPACRRWMAVTPPG
jgi:hypothetical protein